MTDLELLQSTFTTLGVRFSVHEDVGQLHDPETRSWSKELGCFQWTRYLDHEIRLDTECSWGHAELCFFFRANGKFVKQVGYET